MNNEIDKDMSKALEQRLKDEGKMIRSTVCPKAWNPIDSALHEAARTNRQWAMLDRIHVSNGMFI